MKLHILFCLLLFQSAIFTSAEAFEYAVAQYATPVLNTPDFNIVFGGNDGNQLKTDSCGQVRELEYIALPGTLFKILRKRKYKNTEIYQIETDEYKSSANKKLYVDGRFLNSSQKFFLARKHTLPPLNEITAALKKAVGSPYVWGGNILNGVPEMMQLFYKNIHENDKSRYILAGTDCSGLLYLATNGWTPRNSSQLVNYGDGVAIAGAKSSEIAEQLQPLDLILWNGHVIIVLDRENVIESRLDCDNNVGVIITPSKKRIADIMRSRRPSNSWKVGTKNNDIFVVRRWYPKTEY